MKYPLRGDYEIAVKYINNFVLDPVLKTGKAVTQTQNPQLLFSVSGGKAIVYQIKTNSKKYALKCWVEDLGNLKNRYQAIDNYLKTLKIPYFVDFAYQEEGIIVNGEKYPIVRMEWVEGVSFKEFIHNHVSNPDYIRGFAEKFLEMVTTLHQNEISHGDLQHGNIKLRPNGDICLIDYDSLYVPQLSNEKDIIKGLPGYQHPHRKNLDKLSAKSDYFSELIIYLSLLVIAENKDYWAKIKEEERLIFVEKDFINPNSSQIFKDLKKLSPEIIYLSEQLQKSCEVQNIEYLQPLETIVSGYKGKKTPWVFPTNIQILPPNPSPPVDIEVEPSRFDIFIPPKPIKVTPPPLDPWSKFGDSQNDIWSDKFGGNKSPSQDPFDKIRPKEPDKPQQIDTDKDMWNKFENIWKELSNSVVSIWQKLINWFN